MSQPQTRQLDDWNNMECTFCGLFVWWFGREIGATSPRLSAPKPILGGVTAFDTSLTEVSTVWWMWNIVEHRYLARTIVSIQNPWSPVGEYVMFSPSMIPFPMMEASPLLSSIHPRMIYSASCKFYISPLPGKWSARQNMRDCDWIPFAVQFSVICIPAVDVLIVHMLFPSYTY